MTQALSYYLDHFGLRERPFALAPDPEFLYWSPEHRGAYAMLDYGLSTRAPITLLTGEIGAGKTTLLRHFLESLDDTITIGMISNARPMVNDILVRVRAAFGLSVKEDKSEADMFSDIQDFLLDEHRMGRRVLVVIDEAQNLNRDALEDLRMLTNINVGREEVLQLLLVGQPELRDIVRRPDLLQFAQRVAANYHLPSLGVDATGAYIAARIRRAGGNPGIFSRQAAAEVYEATKGVPRLINQLCDLSLTYASADGEKMVKRSTIQRVLDDGVFFSASGFSTGNSTSN